MSERGQRSVCLSPERRVSVCALLGFLSEKGLLRGGNQGVAVLFWFSFFLIFFCFVFFSEGGIQSEFCIQNVVQYFGTGHWCV